VRGQFILVVGPSGAGKDTLIQGARRRLAGRGDIHFPRRLITRPPEPEGENHIALSEADYQAAVAGGRFCLHWRAHGLGYGLPAELGETLAAGRHVVANVSRAVIAEACVRLAPVRVVLVEAAPELLALRLAARGRESDGDQRRRLARAAAPMPEEAEVTRFLNAATVDEEIARFAALLESLAPGSDPLHRDQSIGV
jgi:phosphonate metabolism protein PhnN/1,5-bisphosphokinase (PRPP-forming)